MKKKKSKKSKISMHNNELFEGRKKERLGIKHSWGSIQEAGFEKSLGTGLELGWALVILGSLALRIWLYMRNQGQTSKKMRAPKVGQVTPVLQKDRKGCRSQE